MINCTISSPEKTIEYKDIKSATLPAYFGKLQILPGHGESFISLGKGNILLQQANENVITVPVLGGECHVRNDVVVVVL